MPIEIRKTENEEVMLQRGIGKGTKTKPEKSVSPNKIVNCYFFKTLKILFILAKRQNLLQC